jgi:antitoxin (DNA-binding transcriptional repressor) of toxin-antitoxin stability system
MKAVNVHEAKTKLSAILVEIEQKGEHYLICRNGIPIADLAPHVKHNRISQHPVLKDIEIAYDPIEELTDEEWEKL